MKILVCRHVPQEGLGYFETLFRLADIEYDYQDLSRDIVPRMLEAYQGLIIMGGPMNVDQVEEYPFLKLDYEYIDRGLKLGMPILGFCLGGQLLARALGAKVTRNPQPELGWYELQLTEEVPEEKRGVLKGFPSRFKVFQWHGDTFQLPAGADHLASSALCRNQAFAWGNQVFGLQFHLEVTAEMIAEWLEDEDTVRDWGFQAQDVFRDTRHNLGNAIKLGERLFENFQTILRQNS